RRIESEPQRSQIVISETTGQHIGPSADARRSPEIRLALGIDRAEQGLAVLPAPGLLAFLLRELTLWEWHVDLACGVATELDEDRSPDRLALVPVLQPQHPPTTMNVERPGCGAVALETLRTGVLDPDREIRRPVCRLPFPVARGEAEFG